MYSMNAVLLTGTAVVTLALIFYTASFVLQLRRRRITSGVISTQTAGIALDIIATALMIIGSRKIALTYHGVLGYSALLLQLADTIMLWRLRSRARQSSPEAKGIFRFSCISYGWWVVAYVAGAVIAMHLKR
jgi:tetrahydromethanopterin S-methyltransferase subunit F